jgi:hypothetical protein
MKELITTKISNDALRLLRIIAALTGEKQYQALERILKTELDRLQNQP